MRLGMILDVIRTLGLVLTEIGKLKAAMPGLEGVVGTRGGPDAVAAARSRMLGYEAELEREEVAEGGERVVQELP
jgi:hypothetical protein